VGGPEKHSYHRCRLGYAVGKYGHKFYFSGHMSEEIMPPVVRVFHGWRLRLDSFTSLGRHIEIPLYDIKRAKAPGRHERSILKVPHRLGLRHGCLSLVKGVIALEHAGRNVYKLLEWT
jgi:hypothetical protein